MDWNYLLTKFNLDRMPESMNARKRLRLVTAGLILVAVSMTVSHRFGCVGAGSGRSAATTINPSSSGTRTPSVTTRPELATPSKTDEAGPIESRIGTESVGDVDDARTLINRFFAANQNIDERAQFVADLVRKLCLEGESDLAWEIVASIGSGMIRNNGVEAFFQGSTLPVTDLLDRISDLPYASDATFAFGGLINRLQFGEIEDFLNSREVSGLINNSSPVLNHKGTVGMFLEMTMQDGHNVDQVFSLARRLAEQGYVDSSSLVSLARAAYPESSLDQWRLIEDIDTSSIYGSAAVSLRNEVVREMVINNPDHALQYLINSENTQDADIGIAIQKWAEVDIEGVINWHEENKVSISGHHHSLVAASIAERAASKLEFDGAREWAMEIDDEVMRTELLGKIALLEDENQKARLNR